MASPKRFVLTKKAARHFASVYKKNDYNREKSARELDVADTTFDNRLTLVYELLKDEGFVIRRNQGGTTAHTDEQLHEVWAIYEKYSYNMQAAAEACGIPYPTFGNRIRAARARLGLKSKPRGYHESRQPVRLALPEKGETKRYILTTAQNNTNPDKSWVAIKALAEFYDAEIKIGTITYVRTQDNQGSVKRGTKEVVEKMWYSAELEEFIVDEYEQLAPGLVWCGHMNILPTAVKPLEGLDAYTGRASGIFPHPKYAMNSVASHKKEATKFNFTTGCVTKRNYIAKKAGLKAEASHGTGGLLVEVNSQGNWWVYQLEADKRGWIYDREYVAKPDGTVETHKGIAAIVHGDVHASKGDKDCFDAIWGKGGMMDVLRPKRQYIHDLHNQDNSHHVRKKPHERFRLHVEGRLDVINELKKDAAFLEMAERPWCETLVVRSNHDDHLARFVTDVDWREDMENAELILDANVAALQAIRDRVSFLALEWALRRIGVPKSVTFLGQDATSVVCHDWDGGIECGYHGDQAANGSRGSIEGFAKMGRAATIGHVHGPGIVDLVYAAGITGDIDQGYNVGPGNWAQACVLHHVNGKRQMVILFGGQWRA